MVQSEMETLPVFRRSATLKSSRYWSRLILCYNNEELVLLWFTVGGVGDRLRNKGPLDSHSLDLVAQSR
jgi:hypothetical protein